jgi:LuxR family maltose regulon positive regulatory protein
VASAAALIRATFGLDGLEQMRRSAYLAVKLETDPDSVWYSVARMTLGYSRYLAGQTHEATAPLEQATQSQATMPLVRILVLSVLSLATGRLGRHPQAAELAGAARDLVRTHDLAESAQASLAFTAQGATYARDGRLDAAREELEHSLRVRRRVRGLAAWPTLDSLVVLASVALAQADQAGAQALYEEAADLLATMPGSGGQVTDDLEAIRRRLAAPSVGPPLTRRERTVLHLLQGSLSIAQIAAELYLSANTVKTHTRMIYQKLGVSSREEAVRQARELGIL